MAATPPNDVGAGVGASDQASAPGLRRFVSLFEVRDLLGCSERWLYDQVRSGQLPARKIAGAYRFKISEVEAFADSFLVRPTLP